MNITVLPYTVTQLLNVWDFVHCQQTDQPLLADWNRSSLRRIVHQNHHAPAAPKKNKIDLLFYDKCVRLSVCVCA